MLLFIRLHINGEKGQCPRKTHVAQPGRPWRLKLIAPVASAFFKSRTNFSNSSLNFSGDSHWLKSGM